MSEFLYRTPAQNIERGQEPEEATHTVHILERGKPIGDATIEYFSKPIPVYRISFMYIDPRYRGRGYGSDLTRAIEDMLKRKGKAGILRGAIDPKSPAVGMYERRGWKRVPDSLDQYVFNLPKGVGPEVFRGFDERITKGL